MNVSKKIQSLLDSSQEDYLSYPWESKKWLACWSAQTFFYVSHSSRIMSLCAGLVPTQEEGFHKFLIDHLAEEAGHQFLAKRDVKALGFKLIDFPELPETRLFYEPQYFKALSHPKAFYGYGLMLESLAVGAGKRVFERLQDAGLKSEFLRIHIAEDERHTSSVERLVAGFAPKDQEEILKNFEQSHVGYLAMLDSITRFTKIHSDSGNIAA